MTCVRSGPVSVKDGIDTSKEGEELLKEDRRYVVLLSVSLR